MFKLSLLAGAVLLVVFVFTGKTKLAVLVAILTVIFMVAYKEVAEEKEKNEDSAESGYINSGDGRTALSLHYLKREGG